MLYRVWGVHGYVATADSQSGYRAWPGLTTVAAIGASRESDGDALRLQQEYRLAAVELIGFAKAYAKIRSGV